MKILAIETATMLGECVVAEDENILAEMQLAEGMIHAKELLPAIKSMLDNLRLKLRDIDIVAVDYGPGSYTGIRVGVIVAKTIGYLLKNKIVGVYSLDAMIYNAKCPAGAVFCPMIDAKWKQIYTAVYKDYQRISGPFAIQPDKFIKECPEGATIFGDGAEAYRDLFSQAGFQIEKIHRWQPRARFVAKIGLKLFKEDKIEDAMGLGPKYLRPTEAEVRFGRAKL
jgi:tRNA threonylcarbamoyladenosine biosynthesis protein TsaB